MKHSSISCLILVLILTGVLAAQDRPFNVLISGSITMPTGDFGKEIGEWARITSRSGFQIGEKIGMAQTGYGFGAELIFPIKFKGFDWVFSGHYLTNRQTDEAIEPFFTDLASDSVNQVNILFDLGNHINIPNMLGFRYSVSPSPDFGFYLQVLAGLNFSKAGSITALANGVRAEKTTYEWARDFGFEVGVGMDLWRKFSLGVRYLSLATPKYEGTRTLSETYFPEIPLRENRILGEARSISMLKINLGYYIF